VLRLNFLVALSFGEALRLLNSLLALYGQLIQSHFFPPDNVSKKFLTAENAVISEVIG
jgi:hypothetical protein